MSSTTNTKLLPSSELSTTELVRDPGGVERTSALDHEKGRVVGASLLCYCVDPMWGRLYFLLGKERKNTRWPGGSERWSDFGGRTASRNEDPEETAAREFWEESMAMVRYFDEDTVPRSEYQDIADSLRRGEFTFQFTLGFGYENKPRSYVTFVKQVPWDPHGLYRFRQSRDMLMNASLHYGGDRWDAMLSNHPGVREVTTSPSGGKTIQVRKDFLEKKSIGLWSVPQLQHAVEFDGVMSSRNGRVERCRPMFTGFLELLLSELSFYCPETVQETV